MGGCVVEELVFCELIIGVVFDIEQVIKIVCLMVIEFGMSFKLGVVKYGFEYGDLFFGCIMGIQLDYFYEVVCEIDEEVCKFIEVVYIEVWEILIEYCDVLDILVGELLEKEILY